MKPLHSFIGIAIVLASLGLALAGCSALEAPPTAAPTRSATETRTTTQRPPGSAVVFPTASSTPSSTPTPRPSLPPGDTPTPLFKPITGKPPAPQITPAFPTSTLYPLIPVEPSPIAPPPAAEYRLKAWSEAEALAMARRMKDYLYEFVFPNAGNSLDLIPYTPHAVNTAAREMQLRYPDSADQEQVEWLAAFSESLYSRASDEWLVEQIDRRLNLGWLDPANLGDGLLSFGFDAQIAKAEEYRVQGFQAPKNPFMNLFGDGRPGYIWEVAGDEGGDYYGSIYLAVEQLEDSSFRTARIFSNKHAYPNSVMSEMDVLDLTGDGQPEVIVSDFIFTFPWRITFVGVYTWRDGKFDELAHGNFDSGNSSGSPEWDYSDPGKDGAVDIEVEYIPDSLYLQYQHKKLRWNGMYFEIAEHWVELPSTTGQVEFDRWQTWLDYAQEFLEFEGADELYLYLIKNPPEWMGSAYPDYIRFHRAMAAAYSSRPEEARAMLQEIIDTPLYRDSSLVPGIAAAFLKDYAGDADLLRSCQAAWRVLDNVAKPLRGTGPHTEDEMMKAGLDIRFINPPCSMRSAFRLLLNSLTLGVDDDVTALLRRSGAPVLRSIRDDFDGDGKEDWLVVIDTKDAGRSSEAWVFVAEGSRFLTAPVDEFDRFSELADVERSNLPVRIEYFYFPDTDKPAIALQTGDAFRLFQMLHRGEYVETNTLLFERSGVEDFSIAPSSYEVSLEYEPDSWRSSNTYRYDAYLRSFLAIDPVEALIFERGDIEGAIRLIHGLLDRLDPADNRYAIEGGRLGYFLGLAYELSGDPEAAVEAYLRVWRDYPSSPYALMARMKLEPVR